MNTFNETGATPDGEYDAGRQMFTVPYGTAEERAEANEKYGAMVEFYTQVICPPAWPPSLLHGMLRGGIHAYGNGAYHFGPRKLRCPCSTSISLKHPSYPGV